MNSRTLKIALAVSVGLNLFALGGGAAYLIGRDRIERRLDDQRQPGRDKPLREVLEKLEPETRDRVHMALRASALSARPDFEAARAARREAMAAAGAPTLDTARIDVLLAQSRAAEMRGRARLEAGAVAILATLDPEERKALAPLLQRRSDARRGQARQAGEGRPTAEGARP
ncbi:periplasmic heavy metal sensor [Brevundimonas sp. SORGH_AS_0993]|uniref:periplasmic heavy metal sensor n=1 Tax=Brevundimonas sp. SORGH_AS_0993 TaxID=3041794 RepID=UPI002786E88A|nr:periplasmic heavy metal sensor [Brevundimonas sp. SORGH_AS_0993]MDQ1155549.1 putative membrane protein [Brevundimonas sp. SORGH_AS_0993]